MKTLRSRLRILLFLLVLCFVTVPMIVAVTGTALAQTNETVSSKARLVYVIPVEQTIETGLEKFLIRGFKEAEEANADYIILRISTFGGSVEAAANIGELIRKSPIETIAYVEGKAISAGSYISLNADQIIMGDGSTIGAAAVVTLDGERVEDSKTIATWAGMMHAAAEKNGRNPEYAVGMVDDRHIVEVPEIGKTFGEGQLIVFTADEALAAGYAEARAKTLDDVLEYLNAGQAHVEFVDQSFAESLARFFTNPFIAPILLLIGIAGIGIEIFVPGFGFPGIIGVLAFIAYFFGHYTAGFAGVEHIVLFVIGVILLFIEIFVPSFGIFGILGVASLFGGIIMAAYDASNAILSLLIALIVAIVIIVVISIVFQKKGIWNKFILRDSMTKEEGYSSQSSKEDLLGKTGVTITPLRPAGVVNIDGQRVDVVSSGSFILQNKPVEVVQVEGTRVVVREIQEEA